MESNITKEDIESLGWEHQITSIDKMGITREEYKLVKKYPNIILAEPMGEYWEMKVSGMMQWGKWYQYPVEITNTNWGGFTGATNTERVYKGNIPGKDALITLMNWLKISTQ